MVNIVLVSHSKILTEGVRELALQMTQDKVIIKCAGGLDDPNNPIGTDPFKIIKAIKEAYSDDGILVLMDIGSAIMSTEIAIEQLQKKIQDKVLLSEAPLVEGAIAAAAQAMTGADLETVAKEAQNALLAKATLLQPESIETSNDDIDLSRDGIELSIIVPNKLGLHARPAAKLVDIVNRYDAFVFIRKENGFFVSAKSISQVSTLGAKKGEKLIFKISGLESELIKKALIDFTAQNFQDPLKDVEPIGVLLKNKDTYTKSFILGIPASEGIAIEKTYWVNQNIPKVIKQTINDSSREITTLEKAISDTRDELITLQSKIRMEVTASESQIFNFHILLLKDSDFINKVTTQIQNKRENAAYAWIKNIQFLEKKYLKMDSEYFQARAADITAVGNKVLLKLLGKTESIIELKEPGILIAEDLGPAETAQLDTKFVKGIITKNGGATSHSAILARSLGIPAIVGLGDQIDQIPSGEILAMNGESGEVWLAKKNPGKIAQLQKQKEKAVLTQQKMRAIAKVPAITKNGKQYPILANISSPKEARIAFQNGADGIGLYRTEFLFMNRKTPPTEEEQYQIYKSVCENIQGLAVTIRTLDVGGDKPIPYLGIEKEKNPFLGLRGIRYCLYNTDLFKTQLRAICRISADFPIQIMFPMVAVEEEVQAAKSLLKEVQKDLKTQGIPFSKKMKVGIMLEVPSTIFCIPALAAEVDFFSIGTNDLTQYLLAMDRGNPSVAKYRSPLHPAVMQAIQEVITHSKNEKIEISMCGELAGNPQVTQTLVNMGLDKFSMSSPSIPKIKEIIRNIAYTKDKKTMIV